MIDEHRTHSVHRQLWRGASIQLLPTAVLFILGIVVSSMFGNTRRGDFDQRLIALMGVIVFVIFANSFIRVLSKTIARHFTYYHLNIGRAAALQFLLRTFGYVAIFLMTLQLIGVPVGKLLLGGAAIGIILGVAAQQALANFFASIVLIISHPFAVGQHVIINSGALGGKYVGEITDIGLTHSHLKESDGHIVLLPNATLLSAATISITKTLPDNLPK